MSFIFYMTYSPFFLPSEADTNRVFAPGETFSLPFSVKTSGAGGNFTIRATNDRGFTSTFPSSLVLDTGGSANGTVNLTAPVTTTSGTDVTLTIEAESPGGADTNYLVLRLAVLKTVTLQLKCEGSE